MTVRYFDVCNGDADGLCAVLQWRLHAPAPATLITGLKRELSLLERVPAAAGDEVLVCDLSMQRNQSALLRLLELGVHVRYFDHHAAPDIPVHPLLQAHVEFGSEVCTSVLMDCYLGGAFGVWAAVGAYGDNLTLVADRMVHDLGLAQEDRARLRTLGEAINYNAYGDDEQDVHIAPARLYEVLARYRDPRDFLACESIAQELDTLRHEDLAQAFGFEPYWHDERASVHLLPDAAWSRRVIGCLANELVNREPQRAHAVLKPTRSGGYVASVRAPLSAPDGAGAFCEQFGGAGRAAAAGIDHLPADDVARFIAAFAAARWG